jgi:transcriptional regulator with XRE-family HTH domain
MQRHGKRQLTPEDAFAKVLKEARQTAKLSQEQLGFDSGYHRTYIGMLERGLMNPSLRTILSIAAALRMPAGQLIGAVEQTLGRPWRQPEKKVGRRPQSKTG